MLLECCFSNVRHKLNLMSSKDSTNHEKYADCMAIKRSSTGYGYFAQILTLFFPIYSLFFSTCYDIAVLNTGQIVQLFYHFIVWRSYNEQKYHVFEYFENKIFEKKNVKSWNKDHSFAVPNSKVFNWQKSHVFWLNIIQISLMLRNALPWLKRSPNYVCYV